MSRDASKSVDGFVYQRYYSILQILNNHEMEYILEEGCELLM